MITENFLAREWPRRELNAALQREVRSRQTVVIPIVAVPPDALADYPLLLDKRYLAWADGVERVADELALLFDREPAGDWSYQHPRDHVGVVWVRINAAAANHGHLHDVVLRWGPLIKRLRIEALGPDPVSLVHHKTQPDELVLHVSVDPAAIVAFGQGPPPDEAPLNVDEGWTRSAGWSFAGDVSPGYQSPSPEDPDGICYHVRLSRRWLLTHQEFNLSRQEVLRRFVNPWRDGRQVLSGGRAWHPERARLVIYAGPRLTERQRALGQGWLKATEFGEDVTDRLLDS